MGHRKLSASTLHLLLLDVRPDQCEEILLLTLQLPHHICQVTQGWLSLI